ncbi:hypothetical protein BVX98_06795 [bacterium F11]|nr:hypothetical protein BVX98_06795 [bacterium F11]
MKDRIDIQITKKLILVGLVFLLVQPVTAALFSSKKTAEKIRERIAQLPENGRLRTKSILYSDLGTFYYKNGEFEDAAEAFEKSLQYRPNRFMKRHIYRFLGKSYESYGRLDKCLAAYEQSVYYDRRNWKRHRDLAQIYEKVHLYENAIESYRIAIKRSHKEGSLCVSLGRTYRKMGLYKEAEENLLKAQSLSPQDKTFYRELSLVYEGKSQFQKALLTFEKVISESSPAEDWIRFVYLSVLSDNKTFANQGMDQLRKKKVTEETLNFYETLAQLTNGTLENLFTQKETDPMIERLFTEIVR